MPILQSSDYPAIRAALDTSLDSAALPDDVIALPIYASAADDAVYARDPDADAHITAGGSTARHIKAAAVFYCASLLAPALPRIVAETIGDYTYRRDLPAFDALATQLWDRGDDELAAYLSVGAAAPNRPTAFAAACGRRGA